MTVLPNLTRAQPLGLDHQRLARLDHGLNLLRQCIAGSLVCTLVLVDRDTGLRFASRPVPPTLKG